MVKAAGLKSQTQEISMDENYLTIIIREVKNNSNILAPWRLGNSFGS